jgi:hypothetical protein
VNKTSTKKPEDNPPESERRRIGTVVHDDRGNASVKWRDAPVDFKRTVLEVSGEPGLSIKTDESFDPYARRQQPRADARRHGHTARTDLRKLSEHIKMMRELEERKRNDGGVEE